MWEKDLLNLGFAEINDDGDIEISNKQLSRILNLGQSCFSLDESEGYQGGKLSFRFFNPTFPEWENLYKN